MNLIVAVDKNWAIGYKNRLLTHLPGDLKYFKEKTTGKVVVVGQKTLESFPGGKPLLNRANIVLTDILGYDGKGAVVVNSLGELEKELEKCNTEDIFISGGESVYRQLLPLCDTAYITKIDHAYEADTWMPNLDESKEWELVDTSEEQTRSSTIYHFLTYKRKS